MGWGRCNGGVRYDEPYQVLLMKVVRYCAFSQCLSTAESQFNLGDGVFTYAWNLFRKLLQR